MSETLQLADNARLRTDAPAAAALMNARSASQVWAWDVGPEKPKLPTRPEPPQGKDGSPAYDLAKIEFAVVLEEYQAALKRYSADMLAYGKWDHEGGPVLLDWWDCDAKMNFANDRRAVAEGRQTKCRYYLSSRTRGHGDLPNQGLPAGVKPGRKHADNLQRERDGDTDMLHAQRRDPVFGEQELRQ